MTASHPVPSEGSTTPLAESCAHEWAIWPETDGLEQRCRKCGAYRPTPEADKFWKKLTSTGTTPLPVQIDATPLNKQPPDSWMAGAFDVIDAEEESDYCMGCNPEPTIGELECGTCASCGKELA